MSLRRILVPVLPDVPPSPQLDAALQLARALGAHIAALHIRPDPEALFATIPEALLTAGAERARYEAEASAEATQAEAGFAAWRARQGLAAEAPGADGVSAGWSSRVGPLQTVLARAGRLADLIVLGFPGMPHLVTGHAFDVALLETGRPVLLAPVPPADAMLRHVMIAWNGSLEAARAVAGALPLLRGAGRISVFTAAQEEGASPACAGELVAYLAGHGLVAAPVTTQDADAQAGPALLRAAVEAGVSLLVMGAYTHGRIRHLLRGGMTTDVLKQAALPVVMAH
ncbi:Universal stress protein [Rhodovastum atsumiense]|nr:universal stress protein [Rhodovastum atsumiense]CAH2601517.1 Universal stress protein [Rhodovastum atsumiense]